VDVLENLGLDVAEIDHINVARRVPSPAHEYDCPSCNASHHARYPCSYTPVVLDPFDLEAWPIPSGSGRIYGSDALDVWALVDDVDYAWAVQWPWSVLRRPGRQPYLRRSNEAPTFRLAGSGVRVRAVQQTIYLHVAIMQRTGIAPPCSEHKLVDHINVDSLDCRRNNLRWATYSVNRKNRRETTP
jgi:hypothetical protein